MGTRDTTVANEAAVCAANAAAHSMACIFAEQFDGTPDSFAVAVGDLAERLGALCDRTANALILDDGPAQQCALDVALVAEASRTMAKLNKELADGQAATYPPRRAESRPVLRWRAERSTPFSRVVCAPTGLRTTGPSVSMWRTAEVCAAGRVRGSDRL